jgi:glyoxylase-like metal-dependent hydrolase (beta-lactamase superfamily II)
METTCLCRSDPENFMSRKLKVFASLIRLPVLAGLLAWGLSAGPAAAGGAASTPAAATGATEIQLYALDCGRAEFKGSMGLFSDTDDYDGQSGTMADPCFLIKHPKGILLWDTGLGDQVAAHPEGEPVFGGAIQIHVDRTLQSQLQALGLKPEDITYIAFSHFHFDHVGNANLFTHSKWIINKAELAAALSSSPPPSVDPAQFSAYATVEKQMIAGDYDVFGDQSVRILFMPGHTPGSQALLVKLPHSGYVALTGDLYHSRDNRRFKRVPSVNTERADTLASMDRFEHIVANLHARVVIQHDLEDFRGLPKFPGYLD